VTAESELPGPSEVLERLDALTKSLGDVATQLSTVSQSFIRTRRQGVRIVIGLTASLALDVVLTIVVTLLSLSSLSQSATLHASQLTACSIGNQSKVEQQQLWAYLFQLSGGVKNSQEEQFLSFVKKTFAPVNCTALYH
jgi:hypothetical protein